MLTTTTPSGPCSATTGTRTTVIAPVGPDTCTSEPPKSAATNPATIAVISPASAPSPVVMPKARARGMATTATVSPATTSPRPEAAQPAYIGRATGRDRVVHNV